MRFLTLPEAELPAAVRRQVFALEEQVWPGIPSSGHDPRLSPVSVLLLDGDQVLAGLSILSRTIVHKRRSLRASGLSSVVTDPARRREGLGLRLVAQARELIRASGADLGIFTCDRELRFFYVRAGWQVLPGTVLVGGTPAEPFPSDQFDKVTLGGFFTPAARPEDFVGERVELYPGTIDKLW